MKIKIDRTKIIKAVKELEGIEIVLENADDAKEAVDLILRKSELFKGELGKKLKDIKVTTTQEYETSAVNYNLIIMMEFIFASGVTGDAKVILIKELQDFFSKF